MKVQSPRMAGTGHEALQMYNDETRKHVKNTHLDLKVNNNHKANILIAAASLYAQHGFEGTSINAVAEKAGVKKSLVQYHFKNKELLWQAAVRQVWEQRSDALPRYLDKVVLAKVSEEDQQDMIRELCKQLLKFTFDHPQWVKIMFQEASTPGPRLDWMVSEFFQDDFDNGKAMVELAQSKQLLPQVHAMDLLHILSGALIYLVNVAPITQRVMGEDPASDAYIDRHVDTLMAILRGLGKT
jgi:AcrR family transcriptional regulator